jgi:hypothetical protein
MRKWTARFVMLDAFSLDWQLPSRIELSEESVRGASATGTGAQASSLATGGAEVNGNRDGCHLDLQSREAATELVTGSH